MSMPNAENLAPQITRRVAKELSDLHANPPEGITVLLNEQNVSDIQAEIEGPVGTPYQGGHFHVKLVLGKEFPSSPPKGFFITKIFHPNVSRSGEICVNTLKKDWKEDLGIKHILLVIKCLLIVPNPESALNEDAAKLLLEHYDDYCKRAKMITEIHAMRPVSLKNVDKVMNIDEKLFSSSSLTIESVTRRPLEDENSKGPQAKKHAPSATQSRTDILKTSVANLSNPTTSKEMINRKRIFRRL